MAKGKERQALAIRYAAERASKVGVPCILDRAFGALQAEASRIFAKSEEKRMNGGASGHFVLKNGEVSGYLKDGDKLVQFGRGGAVAVITEADYDPDGVNQSIRNQLAAQR
jgi:hypothetical protein